MLLDLQYLLAAFLVAIFSYKFLLKKKSSQGYPPGPRGYPVVGNFFQLGSHRHKTFIEWGKQYGDILGLYLGKNRVVVLNNYKHIKEAFSENVFTGRPMGQSLKDRNLGAARGIIFNENQSWVEQRRFCLRNLRDLGFGKKGMEVLLMEEVEELCKNFAKTVGQPISTQNKFNAAVLNALWSIVTGKRYSHDDPVLMDILKQLTQLISKPTIMSTLAQFFPAVYTLRKTFPTLFPNPGKDFNEKTYAFLRAIVQEHKDTLQVDAPRDFIDVYINQIGKTDEVNSSFYKDEGEKSLLVSMLDLFVAGAETTSTTMTWAFLLLAMYPEVQEKVYKEILAKTGNSRPVSLNDRQTMPYLEATIMEVTRFASLVPLGVSHRAMEDTKFHGFTIPKDTIMMPNLYSASRDKSAWGDDVENFRPERHLSEDLQTVHRHEALIPFSVGKRVCPGEVLAGQELVLFLGNLLQRFRISTVPGEERPTFETESLAVLMPKPHRLILHDRSLS